MLLMLCALAAVTSTASATGANPAADVQLQADRITLGDLVARMPEPWASLDLGAAPAPMQSRWVLANQVHAAVAAAHLARPPMAVPRRVRVTRSGQVFSAPTLRPLILEQVQQSLPPQATVRSLIIHAGAVMPEGPVSLRLAWSTPAHGGRQMVMAHLEADGDARSMVPVTLDLNMPQTRAAHIVARGAPVHAVLSTGNVTVQQSAVAQSAGGLGDTITLLPDGGSRMLHGRVLDARTVEVLP